MLTAENAHAPSCTTIQGQYRDTIQDQGDRLVFDSGWTPNTIVDSAWLLFAALLRGRPRRRGIQFWALGAGKPAWDYLPPAASPETERLHEEVDRHPLSDIVYLDENGEEVPGPTPRIEVRASFSGSRRIRTLREFGLFGGNATEEKDSGYLINYVIHPRIDLKAGQTLSRRLRLSFRPEVGPAWLEVPLHWLGASPVTDLDGVGEAYAAALEDAKIRTIRELAKVEPTKSNVDLALMKLVELRAKARLALRTAAEFSPMPDLLDRTVWDVIVTPTATLAADAGAPEEAVQRLREQAGALQLALDNRFLRRVTIRELAQPL